MAVVTLTPQAREQLDRLPGAIQPRLADLLARLERWPDVSGAKQLSGALAGHYRLRTGDYRVQFVVARAGDDWSIVVEKIGHRDGFYEG